MSSTAVQANRTKQMRAAGCLRRAHRLSRPHLRAHALPLDPLPHHPCPCPHPPPFSGWEQPEAPGWRKEPPPRRRPAPCRPSHPFRPARLPAAPVGSHRQERPIPLHRRHPPRRLPRVARAGRTPAQSPACRRALRALLRLSRLSPPDPPRLPTAQQPLGRDWRIITF